MFIPDPNFFHPGSEFFLSRIRIKQFKNVTQKLFLSSGKYDPGCSPRIPDPDFHPLWIPDPGVKKAPDPGSATLLSSGWQEERWPVLANEGF
jgi:hypothetical protein